MAVMRSEASMDEGEVCRYARVRKVEWVVKVESRKERSLGRWSSMSGEEGLKEGVGVVEGVEGGGGGSVLLVITRTAQLERPILSLLAAPAAIAQRDACLLPVPRAPILRRLGLSV